MSIARNVDVLSHDLVYKSVNYLNLVPDKFKTLKEKQQ